MTEHEEVITRLFRTMLNVVEKPGSIQEYESLVELQLDNGGLLGLGFRLLSNLLWLDLQVWSWAGNIMIRTQCWNSWKAVGQYVGQSRMKVS